ncbi:hypothetical protein [Streptomyces sp. NPDC050416]|uniref:hypothetical protein n=1 Tax=Streptomyces sp. NPDC050416 TaxID=3365611 RepID=UPI0037BB9963
MISPGFRHSAFKTTRPANTELKWAGDEPLARPRRDQPAGLCSRLLAGAGTAAALGWWSASLNLLLPPVLAA